MVISRTAGTRLTQPGPDSRYAAFPPPSGRREIPCLLRCCTCAVPGRLGCGRIAEFAPSRHVDVGSRIDLVGFLTTRTDVVFVDIRPLHTNLDRLEPVAGSVLELPFADRSLESVSCLHVAEHVGLGRYGDPLDPDGTKKAAAELARVLAPGGQLLFSLPVGRPRECFNAHRIHAPAAIVDMFAELELLGFAGVDDAGRFAPDRTLDELAGARYACGMFRFTRPGAP